MVFISVFRGKTDISTSIFAQLKAQILTPSIDSSRGFQVQALVVEIGALIIVLFRFQMSSNLSEDIHAFSSLVSHMGLEVLVFLIRVEKQLSTTPSHLFPL